MREKAIRSLCKIGLMRWNNLNPASVFCESSVRDNKNFIVDYYGAKYRGRFDNRADWFLYFFGDSDASRSAFVREIANFITYNTGKPFCCYDVGANRGDFSLALAGIADSILAFEQSPGRFSHLAQNIAECGVTNIEAFNIGLGDVEQAADLLEVDTASQKVKSLTGDRTRNLPNSFPGEFSKDGPFVEGNRLACPDFIRINAGADCRSVLRGLETTLELSQPVIFIEQPMSGRYRPIGETDLRSVLYENAKLYKFSGSPYRRRYKLDDFDANASRIVCYPPKINRMLEQVSCKRNSLRRHSFGH